MLSHNSRQVILRLTSNALQKNRCFEIIIQNFVCRTFILFDYLLQFKQLSQKRLGSFERMNLCQRC